MDELKLIVEKQQVDYALKRKEQQKKSLKEIEEQRKLYENENLDSEEQRKLFYQSQSFHTPEYRLETQRKSREFRLQDEKMKDPFLQGVS